MKALLFSAALAAAAPVAAHEIVSVASRPGVTQPFVILDVGEVKPQAIALLYTGFDYGSIRAPLLFVHHREDGCEHTAYSGAARLASRYPLISVTGGKPPESGPCEPCAAHGYFGREPETAAALAAWMLHRPFLKDTE